MAIPMTALIPAKGTILATILLTALARSEQSVLKRIVALVFLINWRSWPGVWHAQLFGLIPKLRYSMLRYGLTSPKCLSIAQDPFDRKVVSKGFVSADLGDWNGHMSNTSYGKVLDCARFKWLLEVVGPAMSSIEGIWSPLGQTAFSFFKEIPMGVAFEVEVHTVSWDSKWIYYVARFTTAPTKPSSPRTLHCIALSKSCFKLRTSRLSIPPSRVLSISGLGPDRSNWNRTLSLRREGRSRDWLEFGGMEVVRKREEESAGESAEGSGFNTPIPVEIKEDIVEVALGSSSSVSPQTPLLQSQPRGKKDKPKKKRAIVSSPGWESDGMEMYEERRIEQLKVVQRFGNVSGWEEL